MPKSADDHIINLIESYFKGNDSVYDDIVSYATLNINEEASAIFITYVNSSDSFSVEEVWNLMQKASCGWAKADEIHG